MRWQNKDIPDQAILTYIENSDRFRRKVAKLLASIGGKAGAGNMTPEQRSDRASKAGAARWAKRDQEPD